MVKTSSMVYKTLVVGVIVLFIGIGIQPAFADVSFEPDSSELVEITVQFYETDRTYNHTVMLTQGQLAELENLINNVKSNLGSTDNPVETETIFKSTIVSLNELGLIPNDMSIDYAQRLVTGKEQNPRIFKALKRWYNRKEEIFKEDENLFCLISGETINTIFTGPVPILIAMHCLSMLSRYTTFLRWLQDNNNEFWNWWSAKFGNLYYKILILRLGILYILGASINFLPVKFGALIFFSFLNFGNNYWNIAPAEGWIDSTGLYGYKSWSGSFYGYVIGFTGIKIIRGFLDFFYLGTALKVHIEIE